MDLRTWTENPVKGENKKKVLLNTIQIKRAADIYHTWQGDGTDGSHYEVPELYRSVGIDEIEQNNWALTPSKYIELLIMIWKSITKTKWLVFRQKCRRS